NTSVVLGKLEKKMIEFKNLGIVDKNLRSINDLGFETPTEIQEKSLPHILEGKDVIAGSATGSGKTLAFGMGIIQNIEAGQGIQSLILAPTRELAEQIHGDLKDYSKHKRMSITAIYGGVSINPQFEALKKADIVVGTPGRILDHLQRRSLNLSRIKILVLDEADRMLDMGFLDDVTAIMSQCPRKKQTLLFSATIPPNIENLTRKFMNNPIRISLDCYVDPRLLKQVYYDVAPNIKFSLLFHLLKQEKGGLVMVFCNSRSYTDIVSKNLNKVGINAMGIHGGLTQYQRTKVLSKFHSADVFVLVCTDVASRGLDVPNVSHVYNYDIPHDSKQYIHRIGRTARAGESGKVINLLSPMDHDYYNRVLREFDLTIEKAEKPFIEKIDLHQSPRRRSNKPSTFGRQGMGKPKFRRRKSLSC
ncbi:DEAD/DEAH box helicase, partial [Halobacteriota archaeon]